MPTILVVGAQDVALQLTSIFSPPYYRVLNAGSTPEALDLASHAVVIVVDSGLPGGPMELCRRLRSDPVTADIPMVLRYHKRQNVTQALTDASVPSTDFDGLIHALRQLAPELSSGIDLAPDELGEIGEEEDLFDEEPMTVIWRRPEAAPGAAEEWPPAAPVLQQGQDHVEYALSFAGYMNSLIEALEDPSKLSPAEVQRLGQVSQQTPVEAEKCLSVIQGAINTALASTDLQQMKVLSSAKNSLYEKLQRLRTLVQDLPSPSAGDMEWESKEAGLTDGLGGDNLVAQKKKVQSQKSQITLAAEAKEAKRREVAAKRAKEARLRDKYTSRGSARKGGGLNLGWFWISLFAVVILGSGGYIAATLLAKDEKPKITDTKNTLPKMVNVKLQQTAAGIIVQPQAKDDDKDRVSFAIRWFINGQYVKDTRTARLPPSKYKSGDRVEVEVSPRDGVGQGKPMRGQPLTVENKR